MGSLFGTYCQQLGVSRCGPGAQGFCANLITSAYTLGVTVRSVAQRRDQLSPSIDMVLATGGCCSITLCGLGTATW